MIQSSEQKLYAAIKKADAKAMPHKSAQDILKILTHDLALWWINQGNDARHQIFPSLSLVSARALGVFIGQMGEAAWQGQTQRVLECLDWIEADSQMVIVSQETHELTEYVVVLREIALAAQDCRYPRLKNAPAWVAEVIANSKDTVLPLGYGKTPELIRARGEFAE